MKVWEVVAGVGLWLMGSFSFIYWSNRATDSSLLRARYGWARGAEPWLIKLGAALVVIGGIGILIAR